VLNSGTITNLCGGSVRGTVTGAPPVTGACVTTTTSTTSTSTACVPTTVTVTQTLASTPEFGSGGMTMLSGVATAFALLTLIALRRGRGVAAPPQ
jgi:di/tricarboxylate transporter